MTLDHFGAASVEHDSADSMLTRRLEIPSQCRVLLVDDDDLVRSRLTSLVRKAGYEVESVSSGAEALRILRATPCQIVVTDWQMPDMNGIELCRQVRANHAEAYVYVLIWTVMDRKEDLLTGLEAGADDYLVKEAPADVLLARLAVGRRITHVESSLRVISRENRRLSETDALTGAYNLRYLTKYLPRELAQARRSGRPIAILSCDIDGFKQVNDHHGHAAGNDVLRSFVGRAAKCIRDSTDWIARVGGDEFVIVMTDTTLNGATCASQKLCQCFAHAPLPNEAGTPGFSVSIGAVAIEASEQARFANASLADEMLRAADSCLYASKGLGRNQVTAVSMVEVSLTAGRPRAAGQVGRAS